MKVLLLVLAHDGSRRAEILKTEVQHLCTLLNHRLTTTRQASRFYDYIGGVYTHMEASAKVLQKTIVEVEEQASFLEVEAQALVSQMAKTSSKNAFPSAFVNLLLTVNALRSYQGELVKSLAELHGRFEQSLKFSIPDHPAPSVKSVRDSSIADRYYTELARFTYRDLIRFVSDPELLNTSYPYTSAPRIFATTGYQPNSRNHYFTNAEAHDEWAGWFQNTGDSAGQRTLEPAADGDLPQRFVSLRLPFWLPDQVELTPILGHEIAHAVLTDLYGFLGGGDWLSTNQSALSDYMYKMVEEFKQWIPEATIPDALPYIQEITADILALVRFKGAFLFAAVLAQLESPILSAFSNDEFDRSMIVRYIKEIRQIGDTDRLVKWRRFDAKSFYLSHTKGTRNEVTNVLLRLTVLAGVTGKIKALSPDDFTLDLAEATSQVASYLHSLFHAEDDGDDEVPVIALEATKAFEQLATKFIDITYDAFEPAIKKYWTSPKSSEKEHGPVYADYFLNRQRVSNRLQVGWKDYREWVGYPVKVGDMASDIHWQSQWCSAAAKAKGNYVGKDIKSNLLSIAVMEDYLLRTMSSKQLFEQFELRFTPAKVDGGDLLYLQNWNDFFKGGSIATRNHTGAATHEEHVLNPSREIGTFLKKGRWLRTDLPRPKWDREAITGTKGEKENLWPVIDSTATSFALTLYSAHVNSGKPVPADFIGEGMSSTGCILLGRYDVATLTQLVGESAIPSILHKECLAYLRRVVLLGRPEIRHREPNMHRAIGMMFVALASPMAWRIMASWIDAVVRPALVSENIVLHFMISDGWEHVIVLFEHSVDVQSSAVRLEPITKAISDIRHHPCVVRTETIFCNLMLELQGAKSTGERLVSVRFRCRANAAAPISTDELKQHILQIHPVSRVSEFEQKFKGFSVVVRFLTGLTDFEIRVVVPSDRENDRFAAIRFVHERLNQGNKISRLQSQVAF